MSTAFPLAGCALLFAATPSILASESGGSPDWLQLGLGGAALFILYGVLKPLVKSQTDSNERVVKSMERIAEGQATSVEIQRSLLGHAERAADASVAQMQAIAALNGRCEERCPTSNASVRP